MSGRWARGWWVTGGGQSSDNTYRSPEFDKLLHIHPHSRRLCSKPREPSRELGGGAARERPPRALAICFHVAHPHLVVHYRVRVRVDRVEPLRFGVRAPDPAEGRLRVVDEARDVRVVPQHLPVRADPLPHRGHSSDAAHGWSVQDRIAGNLRRRLRKNWSRLPAKSMPTTRPLSELATST
eukprot:gene11696-biopygen12404